MVRARTACGAVVTLLLAGCGTSTTVVTTAGDPVPSPYGGPMHVKQSLADRASVMERGGAAARALECDGAPGDGGGGDYADGGLETVQGSPAEALENYLDQETWGQVPDVGYRVERDDGDRVLLSYDVDQRTKVAFIAADGIRDWNHDQGWGIESWAACDPAELPGDFTEQADIGVWTDVNGGRVPTDTIVSYQGAEHCDWQDITFVMLGRPADGGIQFVSDAGGEFDTMLRSTYAASAKLPEDATDTGFRRDGRALWLTAEKDAAYLVNVADPTDVERWPAARQAILCA